MNNHEDNLCLAMDCIARESKLTDWERGFVESVYRQLEYSKPLSDKQAEKLEDIWERIT